VGALLRSGWARVATLLALILVFYLGFRHSIRVPRPGQLPETFAFVPVAQEVWQSVWWLVFVALLLVLFAPSPRPMPPASDLLIRRLVLLALFASYAVTAAKRLSKGHTFGLAEAVGPDAVAAVGALGVGLAIALLRWPPTTAWLLGALIALGVIARLVLKVLIPPDPAFADNLPAIERSLERLMSGATPYAIHDFGTHTNPMSYLPLTFLSYLPTHVLGIDIRVTNTVMSLALTAWCWYVLRALALPTTMRNGLALVVALLFALPLRISQGLFAEWAPFNLLVALTFGLLMLARVRLAAAAYGAALAAMPVAAFVAPVLLAVALRTRPLREVLLLGGIVVAVGLTPTALFVLWDAPAFFGAFLLGTTGYWGILASGEPDMPLLLWHRWLGAWLLAVQAALVLGAAALAWARVRTVRGLIALGAGLYLGLVITGPHIALYMTTVVLYLAVFEEAARASALTAGDRVLGLATPPREAYVRAGA
jgi:hypothetical protein